MTGQRLLKIGTLSVSQKTSGWVCINLDIHSYLIVLKVFLYRYSLEMSVVILYAERLTERVNDALNFSCLLLCILPFQVIYAAVPSIINRGANVHYRAAFSTYTYNCVVDKLLKVMVIM